MIAPFLKWPGGKRWLVDVLKGVITNAKPEVYMEPFLGGGAVFFALDPASATLSDSNPDLIETYLAVRERPNEVADRLSEYSNTLECYLAVRSAQPTCEAQRAARLIYLTYTSWGGLYRVNQKGEFNVPFGHSDRAIVAPDRLHEAAQALRNATLVACDFEAAVDNAKAGTFIYADPPYTTRGENNGFVKYNQVYFKWSDQERLAISLKRACDRGAKVCVSGLFHADLLKLYVGWHAVRVKRFSAIARRSSSRKEISEVILLSHRSLNSMNLESIKLTKAYCLSLSNNISL